MTEIQIKTCADSLLHPGTCCTELCASRAVVAGLDSAFVEHARCQNHTYGLTYGGTKPLVWDPEWAPPGPHSHAWVRVLPGRDDVEHAEFNVITPGVVEISEELLARLLTELGWGRVQ